MDVVGPRASGHALGDESLAVNGLKMREENASSAHALQWSMTTTTPTNEVVVIDDEPASTQNSSGETVANASTLIGAADAIAATPPTGAAQPSSVSAGSSLSQSSPPRFRASSADAANAPESSDTASFARDSTLQSTAASRLATSPDRPLPATPPSHVGAGPSRRLPGRVPSDPSSSSSASSRNSRDDASDDSSSPDPAHHPMASSAGRRPAAFSSSQSATPQTKAREQRAGAENLSSPKPAQQQQVDDDLTEDEEIDMSEEEYEREKPRSVGRREDEFEPLQDGRKRRRRRAVVPPGSRLINTRSKMAVPRVTTQMKREAWELASTVSMRRKRKNSAGRSQQAQGGARPTTEPVSLQALQQQQQDQLQAREEIFRQGLHPQQQQRQQRASNSNDGDHLMMDEEDDDDDDDDDMLMMMDDDGGAAGGGAAGSRQSMAGDGSASGGGRIDEVMYTQTAEDANLSRKSKSLFSLCSRFLQVFGKKNSLSFSLDEVSDQLGVERRRVYDIVNVLEAIHVVRRQGKSSYRWFGFQYLPAAVDALQAQSQKPTADGLRDALQKNADPSDPEIIARCATFNSRSRSMAGLTQRFIMLFIVSSGMNEFVSLERAASILQAKVRRLYDIANILSSLSLISKVRFTGGGSALKTLRKPSFVWNGFQQDKLEKLIAAEEPPRLEVVQFSLSLANGAKERRSSARQSAAMEGTVSESIAPTTIVAPSRQGPIQAVATSSSASLLAVSTAAAMLAQKSAQMASNASGSSAASNGVGAGAGVGVSAAESVRRGTKRSAFEAELFDDESDMEEEDAEYRRALAVSASRRSGDDGTRGSREGGMSDGTVSEKEDGDEDDEEDDDDDEPSDGGGDGGTGGRDGKGGDDDRGEAAVRPKRKRRRKLLFSRMFYVKKSPKMLRGVPQSRITTPGKSGGAVGVADAPPGSGGSGSVAVNRAKMGGTAKRLPMDTLSPKEDVSVAAHSAAASLAASKFHGGSSMDVSMQRQLNFSDEPPPPPHTTAPIALPAPCSFSSTLAHDNMATLSSAAAAITSAALSGSTTQSLDPAALAASQVPAIMLSIPAFQGAHVDAELTELFRKSVHHLNASLADVYTAGLLQLHQQFFRAVEDAGHTRRDALPTFTWSLRGYPTSQ